jgi:cyclophilin family peptidyl-prolyl cis-trans isomerase
LPLSSIHDKAALAAEATEAAGAQGKFWEMHDTIYERQGEWAMQSSDQATETFIGYAKELGLDDKQFSRDLKGGAYRDLVQQRYNEATILSLSSTPTIFINGQYYGSFRDEFYLGGLIKLYNYDGKLYAAPPPMSINPSQPYFALVKTNQGDFCIELLAEQAPQTVNNFVFLAQEGFYDDVLFHVVLPGVVVQTGDPTGGGFGGSGYYFEDEFSPDLSHDAAGVVSMFNKGSPSTNSSQFFITLQAMPDLDNKYPIFGRVAAGMDVVENLTPRNPQLDPYAPSDVIETITIDSSCGM